MPTTSLNDIDFQELWQSARTQRAWSSKGSKDWDKKAASFSSRNTNSPYVNIIIEKLPLSPETTILDIGCGPGTLAIPLAQMVSRVTAIDYSSTMLEILQDHANTQRIKNILPIQCSWEDDWASHNIFPHDIAIASRSLNVADLKSALRKVDHFGNKYVFLADRISPTPFEPDAFKAIGREFVSGPDYIYTINLLYQLGIHPHVDILELDNVFNYASFEDALEAYRWMLKDLTQKEDALLTHYLQQNAIIKEDGSVSIIRENPPRWALIWWQKKIPTHR